MEAVKYNYGETPEEAAKQRLESMVLGGDVDRHEKLEVILAHDFDNLLTVLDALGDYGVNGGSDGLDDKYHAGRNLRISILAALGIDES
jgi:GAF domain-containing protein